MLPIGNSYRVIVTRHYSWVYCTKYKRPPCGSSEFVAFWDSIKNVGGASDVFFPDSVVLPGGELGWGALCPSQAHQGHRHRQQQDEVCPCGPSRCREEGCWTWRLALAGSALINLTNCYSVVWYSAAIFFFIFGSILGIPRHFFGCLLGPDLDFFHTYCWSMQTGRSNRVIIPCSGLNWQKFLTYFPVSQMFLS